MRWEQARFQADIKTVWGGSYNMRALRIGSVLLGLCSSAAALAQYAAVELGPAGYGDSFVWSAAGGKPVGYAYKNGIAIPLWWPSTGSDPDQLPFLPGVHEAGALGTDGTNVVGFFLEPNSFETGAILWNGTHPIDLTPSGYHNCFAYGTGNGQQVGSGELIGSGADHPLLWSGTASSVVDLLPSGANSGIARDVAGGVQVGNVSDRSLTNHAYAWFGDATSGINIEPSGSASSMAFSTDGAQIGGFIQLANTGETHAYLWNAPSATEGIDLNPTGCHNSQVFGVGGGLQVGFQNNFACVWAGTANSVIDLHQALPAGYVSSVALTIDPSDGSIYGYGTNATGTHALKWYADTIPPTISDLKVHPTQIWPPDGKLVDATLDYHVTDNADPHPKSSLTVTCNEPTSPGDVVVVDLHHVKLRADRGTKGSGRVYTIWVTATDAAKNSSRQAVTVTVPHDRAKP